MVLLGGIPELFGDFKSNSPRIVPPPYELELLMENVETWDLTNPE